MTKSMRGHQVILVGILILAAVVRFYRLEALPLGFYHDEAYNGLDALALIEGQQFPIFHEGWEVYAQEAHAERAAVPTRFPIFFEGNYGREPVHIYLMALSIWLFGVTPVAVRAVPAAAGVLAVWTTYLVAQLFVDAKTERDEKSAAAYKLPTTRYYLRVTKYAPLAAAFTMAILFPAVHFSRYGLRMMVFVPVETLCVYFFWRGIAAVQKNAGVKLYNAYFVLSGLLLGFGLYIYAAGRLLPFLFAFFVVLWFAVDWSAAKRYWKPLAVMAAVATLTVMPLLIYFARYPYFLFFRAAYVLENGTGVIEGRPWLTRWYNLGRVMWGMFVQGELNFRHNLPGRPFLDMVQTLFFAIGAGGILQKMVTRSGEKEPVYDSFHRLKGLFLLLWFLVMILPTVLSSSAPHFGRMTGVLPVVAIIIGLGVEQLLRWSHRLKHSLVMSAVVIGALFVSGIWMMRDYFIAYAQHPLMQEQFDEPDWQIGLAMAQLPEDTVLYLTPNQQKLATYYFALKGQKERLRNYNGQGTVVPAGMLGRTAVYFVNQDDTISLQNLQSFFPMGEVQAPLAHFVPFVVKNPTAVLPPPSERGGTFGDEITLYSWEVVQRDGFIEVTLVWHTEQVPTRDYTVYVHLVDENGQLIAQVDRPPAGYPTSDWRPQERIVDVFTVPLPEDMRVADGRIQIRTGFYDLPTLAPLGEPFLLVPTD